MVSSLLRRTAQYHRRFLYFRPKPHIPMGAGPARSRPVLAAAHRQAAGHRPGGTEGGRAELVQRKQKPRSPHQRQLPAPSRTRPPIGPLRSEEHTSELQSRENLVCRLLLEKKK